MNLSRELQVGLAVLAAIAIFILGMRFFEDVPLFGGAYDLYAEFSEVDGLAEGSAVRINGVKVGSVERVQLTSGKDRVRVDFHLQEDITVPRGTRARVAGLSYLGTNYVRLLPGPADNPPLPEGSYVPNAPATSEVGDLLQQLQARAPTLANKLDSVLTNANIAFSEAGGTFETADYLLQNQGSDLRQTLQAFRGSALTLQQLLQGQEARLTRTLANLEVFSQNLRRLSAEQDGQLSTAARNLNVALQKLDRNMAALNTSTERLNDILYKIDEGRGTLGLMVNDSSLYVKLDSAASNLNQVLRNFDENPGRYLRELQLLDIF